MIAPATPDQGIALVTGASSGIGQALAFELARRGWRVAIAARRGEILTEMAAKEPKFIPVILDIEDESATAASLAGLKAEHGAIALAVLNAGGYVPETAASFDMAAFRRTVNLNLLGTAHCLAALMPDMIARKQGQLVIVASVAGYRGLPNSLSYGATKAAQINLAEALYTDLGQYGVKVQVVTPGFIKTPLTDANRFPMPFLMPVADAARAFADGLAGNGFEISFPKRFTFWLRRLRCLPYSVYYRLIKRMTKWGH